MGRDAETIVKHIYTFPTMEGRQSGNGSRERRLGSRSLNAEEAAWRPNSIQERYLQTVKDIGGESLSPFDPYELLARTSNGHVGHGRLRTCTVAIWGRICIFVRASSIVSLLGPNGNELAAHLDLERGYRKYDSKSMI